MKFYDMLQLDPQIIKDMMGKSSVKKEKRKLATAMFLRSILIVLFAILFISALSSDFGSENTPIVSSPWSCTA